MLINFSVSNFSSFKDKITLSMEKTPIQKHPEHILDKGLLSGVGIYGAMPAEKVIYYTASEYCQNSLS